MKSNIIYELIRNIYHLLKRTIKKFKVLRGKYSFRVTEKELKIKLRKLGLKRNSLVYVHSAMSSFGYVEGGADTIVNVILDLIGKKGTVVMPTFTHKTNIFNPKTTKCWTGVISENLRLRKGAIRSINPTHSIVALGPLAKWFTKGHEKSSRPFDRKSPFYKLANKKSYVLMLGDEHNSIIHYVQDKVKFPNLFLKRTYKLKYKINNKVRSIKTKLHHPKGSITYICNGKPCTDVQFLINLYKDEKFEKKGYTKTIKIGNATCRLINTQDFVRVATNYLKKNIKRYKKQYSLLIKNG